MIAFQGSVSLPAVPRCAYCYMVCEQGVTGSFLMVKPAKCECGKNCGHGAADGMKEWFKRRKQVLETMSDEEFYKRMSVYLILSIGYLLMFRFVIFPVMGWIP